MTRARSFDLVWPYVAAAGVGYLLGSLALPAFAALAGGSSSTPLMRVGLVLREDPHAPPVTWPGLDVDLETVRSLLVSPEREVFELLVAVRGLNSAARSDWSRAAKICRSLAWPRCEHAALEQMKEQSRP
jgi:hypothetical protein